MIPLLSGGQERAGVANDVPLTSILLVQNRRNADATGVRLQGKGNVRIWALESERLSKEEFKAVEGVLMGVGPPESSVAGQQVREGCCDCRELGNIFA